MNFGVTERAAGNARERCGLDGIAPSQ